MSLEAEEREGQVLIHYLESSVDPVDSGVVTARGIPEEDLHSQEDLWEGRTSWVAFPECMIVLPRQRSDCIVGPGLLVVRYP